jgi:hypothetical protein
VAAAASWGDSRGVGDAVCNMMHIVRVDGRIRFALLCRYGTHVYSMSHEMVSTDVATEESLQIDWRSLQSYREAYVLQWNQWV